MWPDLTLSTWEDTRDTLHLWTQVVGKVRMALEPMVNHWWQVTLYVSASGLTTSLMQHGDRGLEMEFDFVEHALVIRTTETQERRVPLQPQSVAQFYAQVMAALDDLGVGVRILPRPVEVPLSIPFAEDVQPRAYDVDSARRFWQAAVVVNRVLKRFRGGFTGKVSPVHFFWGGFDMAVTRFSGRTAPKHPGGVPNCPDWVQQLAYSHEVSSCGWWPGGSEEGFFYSYAYPLPPGFAEWPVRPGEAFFDATLGDFLLPYRAVRTAPDPEAMVLEFLQSTYEAAAELAHWDRAALEVPVPPEPDGTGRELRAVARSAGAG